MVSDAYRTVLRRLVSELDGVNWVLTGSLSFALRGLPLEPHDIDIQTDQAGAYMIERRFAAQVQRPVTFVESDRMRSYLGALLLDGLTVEIMGDIQKRPETGDWEPPVELYRYKRYIDIAGMRVPVLSLAYEAEAYRRMGRLERAEMLRRAALQEA
ncbi:hypothetical protein EI42_03386 [Thermosporothrix hazakensis]|uniref:Nucleotidyltransferase AbiEii toxin of type IV toxin-antitoxin system n=1 Tax=Thermosporothrix hazakensis TaxID=644383 RepID=A0A326U4N2_THEHA|nr:hypothetical protein [Thermosporothrix hazakensis]PZW28008.1 hypothetical protein EI42_03386 [Thermosporothrix hazakensis]GCE51229.1 hypothetical protein KTH_60980 [Thermosporothrix hazakensis]